MRKILFVTTFFIFAVSCSDKSNTTVAGADKYIKTITGFTCEKRL